MAAPDLALVPPPSARTAVGLTVFGCDPQEALAFREAAPRFGVEPLLSALPVTAATAELAAGARCVSVGHKTRLTAEHLRALHRAGVRYVSTRSAGTDHIDLATAADIGIRVENVAYSPGSVADYALMLALMALRHATSVLGRAAAGDYRLDERRGRELGELTVGVVGAGRIGSAVIERLRGFGCRILVHDPRSAADQTALDELLSRSDVVTLHVPLTADTHHLLDARRLALLRSDALVVNTARGALIDTDALLDALEAGRLGGAALDVVEGERELFYADHRRLPIEDERMRRLQRLPQVIVSPHTAYYTDRALADTVENSLRGCVRFEEEAR